MDVQPKRYKALCDLIYQRGYTIGSFCEALGVSRSKISRVFRGSVEFDLRDVRRMMKLLGIVDPRPFFFEEYCDKADEVSTDRINVFDTDSKSAAVENPDRRGEKRRFHCTNVGGFCDQVKDESECEHCGFCIIEQLRRKRIQPTLCDDGLLRLQIRRTVTKQDA